MEIINNLNTNTVNEDYHRGWCDAFDGKNIEPCASKFYIEGYNSYNHVASNEESNKFWKMMRMINSSINN